MKPTEEQIADAFTRRSCHLKAVNGEQSLDAFSDSPYFVGPKGRHWDWEHDVMRVDCIILADAYIEEHSDAEIEPNESEDRRRTG